MAKPKSSGNGRLPVLVALALVMGLRISYGKQVLRWSEEFRPGCKPGDSKCVNGGISLKKFGFELGDGTSYGPSLAGWGNAQRQCHTNSSANIRVEPFPNKTSDGFLVIEAAHNPNGYDCYNANAPPSTTYYTSARLITRNKAAFRWKGNTSNSNALRIDVRVQVPLVDGTWPAAWMLPETKQPWCMACGPYGGGWCLGGEIVMMGHTNTNNFTTSSVQSGGRPDASWEDCQEKLGVYNAGTRASGWNVITLLWNATSMRFLANGVEYHHVNVGDWHTGGSDSPFAPFDVPFYLIFDMAIGGSVPGFNINNSAIQSGAARFLVDYIRVYEMVP